ncbi:MAG: cell division protein FtsQ/DivIB [Deltaproteobacteria bacterium]
MDMTTASRRRFFFKTSLFILLLVLCLYLFLHSSFFKVDKIYVTGIDKVQSGEIIHMSGVVKGVNVFLLDEKEAVRAVKLHPLVRNATIIRHLPRTIEIRIEERKVWALVPFKGSLVCIDRDGVCIDKATELSLIDYPIVTFDRLPPYINLGQEVYPQGVKKITAIWDSMTAEQRQDISEFYFDTGKNEITLYTSSGTEIRWGDNSRLKEKVNFLEQTLKLEREMSGQGKDVLEYVDLRFKGQPVIKTGAST